MSQLIPQDTIETIRQQTNIVDIVSQYVQLKKSGKNYTGLCPFHDEKSPSFSVVEDKQIYHCFGCGKGGNVFSFIQEIEGLSFPEAIEKVSELSGVNVAFEFNSQPQMNSPKGLEEAQLIKMHELTKDLYHHILMNTEVGETALNYLKDRGLSDDIIKTFKLGFAPNDRDLLYKVLEKENFSEELLSKSGLFYQRENGEWWGRFYQRIMFPITNFKGKTIAFSGRILEDPSIDAKDLPKYLNSPETDLFNKRFVLYNFQNARSEIRKKNEVVLFEGFMDVISAWSAGVTNGVASMGTSLTVEQINALEKVSEDVLIAYDGDNAGIEATNRAIDLIGSSSAMTIQIVSIPDKMDPDDYRRKFGADALNQLIKTSRETVFQFKKHYLKKDKNIEIEADKLDYLDALLTELVHIPSMIEVDLSLTQLSEEFHVSKDTLQNELNLKKRDYRQQQLPYFKQNQQKEIVIPKHYDAKKISQVEKAEIILIVRLLNERSTYQLLTTRDDIIFFHDVYQELYLHITNYIAMNGEIEIAVFLDYLKEEHLKRAIVDATLQNLSAESSEQEIEDCLNILKMASVKQKIEDLIIQQQEAKKIGNKELEAEAALNIIMLQKQLKSV